MEFYDSHILSVILFTPLAGTLLMLFVPREYENAHRWLGNLFGFLGFAVSVPLVWKFDEVAHIPGFQFIEYAPWIPSIGADYRLGIDGISYLLILLTTLLGAIAILSSWSAIQSRVKEYYILLLLLQVGMLGVFMSLDFFLFYVFWEVMLVPMYFLIGVWGSDRRLYAAIKFFLYTLAGSVLMLLAILAMYFNHAAMHAAAWGCALQAVHEASTFNIEVLLAVVPSFGATLQQWLFWGVFFAFAIKVPMFPFHTWLPDAHTEAPTAGSVILAGVLLKMGTYGFLRFSVPMFPDAVKNPKIMAAVITLSIVAIIYGALVCMMQKDMKKLIAYSSVSHLGFCTLGIFVLTPAGLTGSVIQQINHGLSTGMLFLIVGVLYERRHTRLISDYGGISTPMPNFAAVYLIASLSSLGMPVLNGFIGEFTILKGVFEVNKVWAAWGSLGIVLGAAYLLWLYQRVMYGPVTNPANEKLPDLNAREMACFLPLIALCFWIGVYPAPLFRILEQPVKKIVLTVNPTYYDKPVMARPVAPPQGETAPATLPEGK
ncbi:MAG: NADH-quinone oxidoreductase subunit M [Acidobacteria bacterium]|nr:NADH-quinone oxidoreductase subunit M [Acidobacteriota bacterium]